MTTRIIKPAKIELSDAILWYDMQQPGFGTQFETEVFTAIQRIQLLPKS